MLDFLHSPILHWLLFGVYLLFITAVTIQIIYDTTSPSKTLGYLLLIIFVPIFGVILYLSLGVNYRNRAMYSKKLETDQAMEQSAREYFNNLKREALHAENPSIEHFAPLAYHLATDDIHGLSIYNRVELLNNGEEKFAAVLEALEAAKSTIHIEYYIVRNDKIGNAIKEVLIRKAKEGVKVRFIYDAYGARHIRKGYADELRAAGVEIYPFRELVFIYLANRLNYRNHRKIIVIDGRIGFVGGINIGDEYINSEENKQKYWRDAHLKLEGYSCHSLQYLFLSDWNFCSGQSMRPTEELFPTIKSADQKGETVQIVASGPDSPEPMIMNSIIQAIALSREEVLITTPYFVPSESVLTMLKLAAMSRVRVKILVPKHPDSIMVGFASRSLFRDLLESGVEIYGYTKGFIHAKTSVFDRKMAMVGTANMDNRSFDLNFEVNAVIYDESFAEELAADFYRDIQDAERLDLRSWRKRPKYKVFFDKICYLTSSLL